MDYYHLNKATYFWEKEHKRPVDFEKRDVFTTICEDLKASIFRWPSRIIYLVNAMNWNISRLAEDTTLRKPHAYLRLDITQKDNLVLNWYPRMPMLIDVSGIPILKDTDYIWWSDRWNEGIQPMNRIMMLHDVGFIIRRNEFPHSIKYLLQAIHKHIEFIVSTISQIIEITLMTGMYFEYERLPIPKGKYPSEVETERLIKCSILNVEEISRLDNLKYIMETFKGARLTPKDIIKLFAEVNCNYNRFDKKIKETGIKGVGEVSLRKIIDIIKNDYAELYAKYFPDKNKGQILPFTKKE